jgi:hypothetical protein
MIHWPSVRECEYAVDHTFNIFEHLTINLFSVDWQLCLSEIPLHVALAETIPDVVEGCLCRHASCATDGYYVVVDTLCLLFHVWEHVVHQRDDVASHINKMLKLSRGVNIVRNGYVIRVLYQAKGDSCAGWALTSAFKPFIHSVKPVAFVVLDLLLGQRTRTGQAMERALKPVSKRSYSSFLSVPWTF